MRGSYGFAIKFLFSVHYYIYYFYPLKIRLDHAAYQNSGRPAKPE